MFRPMKWTGKGGLLLAVCLAACLGASSYARLPYALTHANWVFNVIRNWHEFGYARLGGELAINPGGRGLPDQPEIYSGHRKWFMAPTRPAVWLARDPHRGMIMHSALLAALTMLAAWHALGPRWGWRAGLAWALSPGIGRLMAPEPIATPTMWGTLLVLPLVAAIRSHATPAPRIALLCIPLALWVQMNWTTAFLLGSFMLALVSTAPRNQRFVRWALCLALGAALIPVGLAAVHSKFSPPGSGEAGWLVFLRNYSFGAHGYGGANPVGWPAAVVRIGAAAGVGLGPLLIVYLWRAVATGAARRPAALVLPLLGAFAMILLFRNYFAQHPWIAVPILAGATLTALATQPVDSRPSGWRPSWSSMLIGAVGLGWLAMGLQLFEVQTEGMGRIARLLHGTTPRNSVIWFAPALAANPHFHHLEEETALDFDRTIAAWPGKPVEGASGYLLANQPEPTGEWHLVGSTLSSPSPPILLKRVLSWYREHLGRRRAGDAIALDDSYYLFRIP